MTEARFSSAGVEIAYRDEGDGEPILLIHGFASTMRINWVDTQWLATLAKSGRRVIAFDNRGHGDSEKLYDPQYYSADLMAADARQLLDHLGVGRADVMGYSMGARNAAFLTLASPERVRSVVFGGLGINMVRGLAGAKPISAALLAPSIDQVASPTARTFRAFAEQSGGDLRALAACILGSRGPVMPEQLAKIACPVLVAVGSDDVIGGSAEALAALIPGAQALTIPGRDHMKAVGDRVYKEAVLEFLNRRP